MDLFDFNENEEHAKPLAERMRANILKDFVGQSHIAAEGFFLRRAISLDRLGSCIFWEPPGCGKTTLANIIAAQTNGEFLGSLGYEIRSFKLRLLSIEEQMRR